MNKFLNKLYANLQFGLLGKPALEPPIVAYVIRPRDGIQYGYALPPDDNHGSKLAWINHNTPEGVVYIAVCDFCGGNCGQCSTSVGAGIPFNFDLMAKNGKWDQPGWGIHQRR